MFINNDELGLQSFREDVSYIMEANKTMVKLIRFNSNRSEYNQGDYLGIRTKTFDDIPELIYINLGSQAPNDQEDTEHGYDGSGNRTFIGYVRYDVDISNKDIIEFVNDYNYNIKAGTQFKVKLNDAGAYQGQYTFKEFELVMINNGNETNVNEDDYNELDKQN